MFKYISEILGKFTQGQRITALLIVLFSVVVITLGPSIINNNDCREVYNELEKQRSELLRLNSEIIEVQTNCTNKRIAREREISNILDLIEEEMKSLERSSKTSNMASRQSRIEVLDSIETPRSSQPTLVYISENLNFKNIMDNIHHLQEIVCEEDNN